MDGGHSSSAMEEPSNNGAKLMNQLSAFAPDEAAVEKYIGLFGILLGVIGYWLFKRQHMVKVKSAKLDL